MTSRQPSVILQGLNNASAHLTIQERIHVDHYRAANPKAAFNEFMGVVGKPILAGMSKLFGGVKILIKLVGNMKAIANNKGEAIMEKLKKLPDAEFEVMKVVWANDPPITTSMVGARILAW